MTKKSKNKQLVYGVVDQLNEDEAELQAALMDCSTTVSAEQVNSTDRTKNRAVSKEGKEVLYKDGATPLFLAIEETRWTDALDILDTQDEESRASTTTWVVSTGSENTTFGWSLWKRLPLHEACRRQAPAWLIAALLRDAPKTASAKTAFGALPLHLAVQMGASPEVVNLLLVSFWQGIVVKDNGGRTPLDILQNSEDNHLYDPESVQVVTESLARSHESYNQYTREWERRIFERESAHADEVEKLKTHHNNAMEEEAKKQEELQSKLNELQEHIDLHQTEKLKIKETLDLESMKRDDLLKEMELRRVYIASLEDKIEKKDEELKETFDKTKEQEEEIVALINEIELLHGDLQNLIKFHHDQVLQRACTKARSDLEKMVASQQALEGVLVGQQRGMELLLEQRGIPMPKLKPNDEDMDGDGNGANRRANAEYVDTTEAAKAAAMAASQALEKRRRKDEMKSQNRI